MTKLFLNVPTVLITLILIGSGICDDCGCGKKAQARTVAVSDAAHQSEGSALAAR